MAKLYNLARMSTATTGTGTITLGSAVSGYLTFAQAGVSNADVVDYAIKDGANSEIGTGTYTSSGTTLTRTVTKSTNSNAAISLSGTAEVFITPRAETLNGLLIQTNFELFRHPSTGAAGTTSTTYAFPGTALSASTLQFYASLGMNLQSARWSVAWTPGHASNTCKLKLVHADSGPTNITDIAEFIRASASPVTDAANVTIALRGLLEAGVTKTLAHQVAGNGAQAPTIYLSVIECIWGPPINFLVPKMTSATTPAGWTASASGEFDASSPAWKAFDKGQGGYPSSTWIGTSGATTGYLRIDAPSAITPTAYWLVPRATAPTQSPGAWTLEGSNDGSSWTVVDTQSGITGWSVYANDVREFVISSPQAFSKWRLNITDDDGGGALALTEFQLIGA